jgi:transcriptional regulator with XRE-family HTH domain
MDGQRLGRQFRALRIRSRKRQLDVGARANVSRDKVSRIERGLIAGLSVGDVTRAAEALGATLEIRLRWHGELLDRLL